MDKKLKKEKVQKVQTSLCFAPQQMEKFLSMKSAGMHKNATDILYRAVAEYYKQLFGASFY